MVLKIPFIIYGIEEILIISLAKVTLYKMAL
jgi:hypothetical protein